MNDEKMSDKEINNVLIALTDRGLIERLKNSNLVTITEKGRKEFAASALQCLDEKKQYKDADEMKAAIIILTIVSTGKIEENLLSDAGYVFEIIVDEAIPGLQREIENIDFSQGAQCLQEK